MTRNGPATGTAGALLTYTGTLTNYGTGPAYNVVLVDQLPAGLTFVSSSHGAVYNPPPANTVTWSLGTVNAGASISGWLTARVDGGIPNGTVLTDTFSLTWEDVSGNPLGPATSSVNTTIYTAPMLTITKEGPSEVQVGSYITFTGTLTNVGGTAATNVVLVDYLPPGLTFVSSSHTAVYDPVARTITWQLGTVGSGVAIPGWVTLHVDAFLPDGTELANLFSVTWDDGGPSEATANVIARTGPILSVAKTGPAYGSPGGMLTFNISVTNNGGTPAYNVMLVDMLPEKYTYISSSPAGTLSGGNVIWNLGTLAAGASLTVSLTILVDSGVAHGTHLINGAMATWQDGSGNPYGPSSAGLATTFSVDPLLLVSKTGPATANPGENCTYTITITNVSGAGADNVTLVDYIPAGMNYISSSNYGYHDAGLVTWNLGTIAGGASRSVSIVLQVEPTLADVILLQDTVTATWKDNLNNDYGPVSGTAQTRVTPYPVLSVDISGPTVGEPCDTLTFTISVNNTSATVNAQGVMAQYVLPSSTAFVSASDGGTYANGIVTWTLGGLAAGATRQVTVTITYCALPAGSQFISTAGTVWQDPASNYHGPVFDSTATNISTEPAPPPPPPPPPPPDEEAGFRIYQRDIDRAHFEKPSATPASLPIYSVTNLAVNTHGKGHQVSINVNNNGSRAGTYTVYLKVNGKVRDVATVAMPPNSTQQVNWTLENMKPGNYLVEVSDQRASFVVADTQTPNRLALATVFGIFAWAALTASVIIALRRRTGT